MELIAEIITLRAIALKRFINRIGENGNVAEIITLRAIALKLTNLWRGCRLLRCRDHNATSYSTETEWNNRGRQTSKAEIITLRAIALKHTGSTTS